ncbi:MAG: class I SAM-dependent methyltransferase [Patescibacteria group bacterium]
MYVGLPDERNPRRFSEDSTAYCLAAEELCNLPPLAYGEGVFSPSFVCGLNLAKDSVQLSEGESHAALMLGALTQESMLHASTMARKILGKDSRFFVLENDTRSVHPPRIDRSKASFLFGDGRALPLADTSLSFIEGVGVMATMHGSEFYRPIPKEQAKKVFADIARVLRPGGIACFIEPRVLFDAFDHFPTNEFPGLKLHEVPAIQFTSRTPMQYFLQKSNLSLEGESLPFSLGDYLADNPHMQCIVAIRQ